jgi:hypothetical protein
MRRENRKKGKSVARRNRGYTQRKNEDTIKRGGGTRRVGVLGRGRRTGVYNIGRLGKGWSRSVRKRNEVKTKLRERKRKVAHYEEWRDEGEDGGAV